MKKNWRKIVIPLLIGTVLVMGILTVKSILGRKNGSRVNDIPKNGIVSSSVFKKLMSSKDIMMFNGDSGDIKYQWLFLGNDIKKATDINLLMNFENGELEDIKNSTKSEWIQGFQFYETNSIESNPTISIELPIKWDCSGADIYKFDESNNLYKVISGAAVENSEKTTITFTLLDNKGKFYIVGNGSAIDSNINEEKNKTNEEIGKIDNSEDTQKYLTDGIASSGKKSKGKYADTAGDRAQMGLGSNNKDKYQTDPTPEGKPGPIEWQDSVIDKNKIKKVSLSIRCDTLLIPSNYEVAKENGKAEMIPANGVIYATREVEFYEGESVFDVLLREVKKEKIHMEFSMTPVYNSNYIEGINNLYEFDGGELSGWMYKVNGWFPNYGCSRYQLKEGDSIEWVYTCDLGRDVGCEWLGDE